MDGPPLARDGGARRRAGGERGPSPSVSVPRTWRGPATRSSWCSARSDLHELAAILPLREERARRATHRRRELAAQREALEEVSRGDRGRARDADRVRGAAGAAPRTDRVAARARTGCCESGCPRAFLSGRGSQALPGNRRSRGRCDPHDPLSKGRSRCSRRRSLTSGRAPTARSPRACVRRATRSPAKPPGTATRSGASRRHRARSSIPSATRSRTGPCRSGSSC